MEESTVLTTTEAKVQEIDIFLKNNRILQALFLLTLFSSALLLFLIQPLVAKILLPVYGGTPAVWTVCMLFFQTLLLVSYGYAWVLSKMGNYYWRIFHFLMLGLSLLYIPVIFTPEAGNGIPEFSILGALIKQLGLPLLVVGASAPLLQFAYTKIKNHPEGSPYYLYAASNAGSLIALITYPFVTERYLTVNEQLRGWSFLYIVYFVLLLIILLLPYQRVGDAKTISEDIPWRRKLHWTLLSFVPCSLMLGVTYYITTDVAASPLFWVLPLGFYLLSFVITFSKKPIISPEWIQRNILLFLIFPIIGFMVGPSIVWLLVVFHVASLFIISLLCHGVLVKTKPDSSALTTFYFCLAFGGTLAGIFNGIVAPHVFSSAYEYPLVLLLSLVFIPIHKKNPEWLPFLAVLFLLIINYFLPMNSLTGWVKSHRVIEVISLTILVVWTKSMRSLVLGIGVLFFYIFSPWFHSAELLIQVRNFYGIKQVIQKLGVNVLMSNTTNHGIQLVGQPPTGGIGYYGPLNPIISALKEQNPYISSLVIGVGTGIMACQYQAQDSVAMVEIDEQVIQIAQNPKFFTYLSQCPPHIRMVRGDGRKAAEREKDNSFNAIVLDAFSSDAVPTHLITQEAFTTYSQKLKKDGVIIVNLSNRHLFLLPVILAAGRQLDLIVLHKQDSGDPRLGQFPSEWAIITSNENLAFRLMSKNKWRFVNENNGLIWSDDYSNIIPLLKR